MSFTARTRFALAVAIVGLGTAVGAGVAGAETEPYIEPATTVAPEVLSETAAQPVVESASAENAAAQSSLAFTGGDAAGLAAIGAVAVAAGAAITVARRRTAEA